MSVGKKIKKITKISQMKKLFDLHKTYNLIRIGRDNDGGYLVEKSSILNAKHLVSMGLNDDWSFEKHFVSLNKVGVHVYDHTVDNSFWTSYYKKLFSEFRQKFQLDLFKQSFIYFQYLLFFKDKIHYKECIGKGTSLKKALSRINLFPVFLKIDIEGSEYSILEELVLNSNKICGLVIEFHNLDFFLDKILEFTTNFDLQLVHIHGNNFGGKALLGYPLVLEMTFSKNPIPLSNLEPDLPHLLDMPNRVGFSDLDLNIG